MRKPISGGHGFCISPLRTRKNVSHTPSDAGNSTGLASRSPCRMMRRYSPHTPVSNVPRSQITRTSLPMSCVLPMALSVILTFDAVRPMTTLWMSTGASQLSINAATSDTDSPNKSATVLSKCAPVSNIKPPPLILGCWRHVPSVNRFQSCHTTACTLSTRPSSPARSIAAAVRIAGDALPLNAIMSNRPLARCTFMSALASRVLSTIGFSSSTSLPALSNALA